MSDRKRRFRRTTPYFVAAALFATGVFAAPPAVTLSASTLIARVEPGSSLALMSVAHEPDYYMSRIVVRRELLVDDDRDGNVEYAVPQGVAFRSIWIIVDMTTGDSAMVVPNGFVPTEMHQRGAGREKAIEAIANTLEIGRTSAALLVVRPGVGAWSIRAHEGVMADSDKKKDRRMRIDLAKLRALTGGADAPNSLQRGDVVAVLDPALLQYWIRKID